MRDRLIELIDNMVINCPQSCSNSNKKYYEEECNHCISNQVADYLLESGVIVPPCKVASKVFMVHEKCDKNGKEYLDISVGEVVSFSLQADGLWAYCRYFDGLTYWHKVETDFGKTVFLTREQALAKLKEGGEG